MIDDIVSAEKSRGTDKRMEVLQRVCMKNAVMVVRGADIQDPAGLCLDFSIDESNTGHKE